jgi:hypothetical protein
MIGHVFAASGAVTLAIAPSLRTGDYLVLVRDAEAVAGGERVQYVIATLYVDRIIDAAGSPDHWMDGAYYTDLDEAIEDFGIRTSLPVDKVAEQVRYAESRLARLATAH